MATETFKKLIEIDINTKSINELEKSISDINKEIENIQKNEIKVNQSLEEQTVYLKQIEQLESKRNDLTSQQSKLKELSLSQNQKDLQAKKKLEEQEKESSKKALESYQKRQEKAENLFKITEGIGGAFQIAEGSSVLFGQKTSEELEKAQTRILALISLTDGLKKGTEALTNGYKLVGDGLKKAEIGAKLFGTTTRTAIATTGIGILVVALGLLIAYFDDVKKVAKEFAESIGLTDVINNIEVFTEKIGGLSGIFTITKNVVVGLVKEIVNYFKAIGNFLIFDFKALNENFKNAGKELGKSFNEGVKEATENADFERLKKSKELAITMKENELAILKTRNKDVLELETKLIEDKIKLLNLSLEKEKVGSEKYIELQKNQTDLVAQFEINKYAKIQKSFEDSLKNISNGEIRKQIFLNGQLKKGLISQELFEKEKFKLSEKTILDEISLRQKQADFDKNQNDEILKLQLRLSELRLENEKNTLSKIKELNEENLEKEKLQNEIFLQESLNDEFLTYKEFNDQKLQLEIQYLNDKLKLVQKGSIEELEIQKQLEDLKTEEKQKSEQNQSEIDQFYRDKQIENLNKISTDIKNNFEIRKNALSDLKSVQLQNIDEQLKKEEEANGKNTANYLKLTDEKLKIEDDYNKKLSDLQVQRFNKQVETVQQVVSYIKQINDLANQVAQQQIDNINKNIESLQENLQNINSQIDETLSKKEESDNRINEIENNLQTARGSRAESLKRNLEEEAIIRNQNAKKEERLRKEQIEGEKKVQLEKEKIAKIEKQNKERQRIINITEAVINTALGVVKALGSSPPPLNFALAAIVGAIGATQIGIMASQKYEKGGLLSGNSHSNGGIKGTGSFSNVEVEGGEYIINKKSTQKYLPILQKINQNKFENGGVLPNFNSINSELQTTNTIIKEQNTIQPVVSVREIVNVANKVTVIENSGSF